MATLRITGVPEALHRRLEQQAAKEHRSVEQQVSIMLQRALARDRIRELAQPSTPPDVKPASRTGGDRKKRKRRR
jgi:plasmid stability protein